jgi:glycosyltransferase involved in cell wall biosynthesis
VTPCCENGSCCCAREENVCECPHPMVSVITPTWERNDLLLKRCIPSVQVQDYPNVEHVIVSDGPDPELAGIMSGLRRCNHGGCPRSEPWCQRLRYAELEQHPEGEHWGHFARSRAIELSRGDYITYLDDDDLYLPRHCSILVSALNARPEIGFAFSQMQWANGKYTVGHGEPWEGDIGTPMIMHRREILQHAGWNEAHEMEDWRLVKGWMDAGVQWAFVERVTVIIWPGASDYLPPGHHEAATAAQQA